MSKQLATIATDAPLKLELEKLTAREPDTEALRALYAELGFTSLLKELGPAAARVSENQDYALLESPAALRDFVASVPSADEIAVWPEIAPPVGEDAQEGDGYGSRFTAIEFSPRAGVARTARPPEKESERAEWLAALAPWLADSKRPKIVHDPKLIELMLGPVPGVRHATMLYSYLLRPTTAKHKLDDTVLRYLNLTPTGQVGERADMLHRLAPVLRQQVEAQELANIYETIDLPLAPVLAQMEQHGVRVDPEALATMSATMEKEVRTLEKRIWELAGSQINVNSPQQLAEILFDKMNLQPPGAAAPRRAPPRRTCSKSSR